jgi:hypothetical protein
LELIESNIEQNLIEDSIDSCIEIMHTALICGNLRIAEWARDRCITKDPSYPLPADFTNINKLFEKVCGNGHLEVAQWMMARLNITSQQHYKLGALSAAKNGHLPILIWLLNTNADIINGGGIIRTCFVAAAKYLQLDIMQWVHQTYHNTLTDQTFDAAFVAACENNNANEVNKLNVLLWLRNLNWERGINPFRYEVKVNEAGQLVKCRIRQPEEETLRNLTTPMAELGLLNNINPESLEELGKYFL